MKTLKRSVEFISPAFLVGGNQAIAELRPASIRGELRWWFRVLGGTREEEISVFGGVQPKATASKVIVRVGNVTEKHAPFHKPAPMSDLGYLSYFAMASKGNVERAGVRVEQDAFFAPGTTFDLVVVERTPLTDDEHALLERSFDCLVRLGALGYRSTRTFGAMVEVPELTKDVFEAWAQTLSGKVVVRLVKNEVFSSLKQVQSELGAFLRTLRRDNHLPGKKETAFGFSSGNKRSASALRLRPVKVQEGYLPVVVYTDMACACASQEDLVRGETVGL